MNNMKQIVTLTFLLGCGFSVLSQEGKNDPTYSANNYKHPNKATYAKKHFHNVSTEFETIAIKSSDNYKQPHNNAVVASKAGITTVKPDKTKRNVSSKHPFGL
jgi:hypothetical protein